MNLKDLVGETIAQYEIRKSRSAPVPGRSRLDLSWSIEDIQAGQFFSRCCGWGRGHSAAKQILVALMLSLLTIGCRTQHTSDQTRIREQKSPVLVSWLDFNQLPGDLKDRDPLFTAAICDELPRRHEVDFLLTTFNTSTNVEVRRWLAMSVLGEIDDRRIYDDLTNHLTDNEDEESYYVAIYLASRGNKTALATLNRHYFNYPVSSVEWAYAAGLFGKYRYTPATTNLVDSLNAASLNLAAAACNSLQEIFPDSPRDFKGPGEAEAYFRKRLGEARE